jgi:hypothetical protein
VPVRIISMAACAQSRILHLFHRSPFRPSRPTGTPILNSIIIVPARIAPIYSRNVAARHGQPETLAGGNVTAEGQVRVVKL